MVSHHTPGLLVALWVCTTIAKHCHNPISCFSGRYPDYNTVADCIVGAGGLEQNRYHSDLMSCEGSDCVNLDPLTHPQTNNEKQTPRKKLLRKLKGSKRQKRKKKRKSRRKRRHRCT